MDLLHVFLVFLASLTTVCSLPVDVLCGFPPKVVIDSSPNYTQPCSDDSLETNSPLRKICDRIQIESDCKIASNDKKRFPFDDIISKLFNPEGEGNDRSMRLKQNCGYMGEMHLIETDVKCEELCGDKAFLVCDLFVAMDQVLRSYFETVIGADGSGYRDLETFVHSGKYKYMFPYPVEGSFHTPRQLDQCMTEEPDNDTAAVCKMVGAVAVEIVKSGKDFKPSPFNFLGKLATNWKPCENISSLDALKLPTVVGILQDQSECSKKCKEANVQICKVLFFGLQSLLAESGTVSNAVVNVDNTPALSMTSNTDEGNENSDPNEDKPGGDTLVENGANNEGSNDDAGDTSAPGDIIPEKDEESIAGLEGGKETPDTLEQNLPASGGEHSEQPVVNDAGENKDDAPPIDGQTGDEPEGHESIKNNPDAVDTDPMGTGKELAGGSGTPKEDNDGQTNEQSELTNNDGLVNGDNIDENEPSSATGDSNPDNGGVQNENTPDNGENKEDLDGLDQDGSQNEPLGNEKSQMESEQISTETTSSTSSVTLIDSTSETWLTENVGNLNADGKSGDITFKEEKPVPKPDQASDVKETLVGNKEDSYKQSETPYEDEETEGGHFMAYMLVFIVVCVAGYILFHNKQKIIALVIEGKGPAGGRRPSTKEYKRLKTEDVMPSLEKSAYSKNYVF